MKLQDICSKVTAVSVATISAMAGIVAIVGVICISIITFAPQRAVVDEVADLLPGNSHVVELGPFGENGHEAEAI